MKVSDEEIGLFGEVEPRQPSPARLVAGFARYGAAALAWVFPESALLRPSAGMSRRWRVLLFGGIAVFMATVALVVFWLLGVEEKTARHAATRFAAALVNDDSSSAPSGAADYVGGVRAYFGPVSGARLIADHNKGVNTGDASDTRSYFVAELLLRTRRGPAVIEVAFDNHAVSSDRISGVYELRPKDAPALSPVERKQLAAAFAARGGRPADQVVLAGGSVELSRPNVHAAHSTPSHAKPPVAPVAVPDARLNAAAKQLRCVQDAHGDVVKLQKCLQT